jgi:hypothetical protein
MQHPITVPSSTLSAANSHRAVGPMGCLAGRLGAGQPDHPVHQGLTQRRLARLAGRVAQQALDPGFGEAALPTPDRRPAHVRAPGDLGNRQPRRRSQDDPSPRHMLLRTVSIGYDRLQTSAIRSRNPRADKMSHAPACHNPAPL